MVMPDCDLDKAIQVGERLRQCIAAAPFEVGGRAGTLLVTASVGVAALERSGDTPELILKRATRRSIARSGTDATGWSPMPPELTLGWKRAESGRILGLALGFRLDAALEALGLRLYTSCVFVTLGYAIEFDFVDLSARL